MKDKILVFIPMYNCEKQIIRVIGQLRGTIYKYISEVIIVDNQSSDQGVDAVIHFLKNTSMAFPVKLLRNRDNYGLGGSHKVAFNYAIRNRFDYIIVLHGDDQGHIKDALPLIRRRVYKKYDCCLGARFLKKSRLKGYSKSREFGNRLFNILFSISVRRRIFDLGAGLNIYAVDMLRSEYYKKFPDNLTFNCYMLFALNAYQQTCMFFPITWTEEDQNSNVKIVKQAWQTLQMVMGYFLYRTKYLQTDAREKNFDLYESDLIYSTGKGK